MTADGTQVVDTTGAALGGIEPIGAASDAQTDDQILDAAPETGSQAEPEAPETPVTEGAEAAPAGDAKPDANKDADPDAALDAPAVVPPELKHLMADPKVAPHLQRLVDQNTAYREFGTVSQLRKISETLQTVGGVEAITQLAEKSEHLESADDAFNGTPDQQAELAQEWMQDNPESFRSMIVQASKLLAQNDPQGYSQIAGDIFASRMQQLGWDEQIAAIAQAIEANDTRRLVGLANWLVDNARQNKVEYRGAQGKVDPQRQQFDRERSQFQKDQQEHQVARVRDFQTRVHDDVTKQVNASIGGVLANALKGSVFSDAGKKAIAESVFREIDTALKADRSLGRAFTTLLRSDNKLSDATRQQAVQLLVARAKALVAPTSKKVIAARTQEVITRQTDVNARKTNAASRPDIRGGAPPAVRTQILDRKTADRMSDDEIMNA